MGGRRRLPPEFLPTLQQVGIGADPKVLAELGFPINQDGALVFPEKSDPDANQPSYDDYPEATGATVVDEGYDGYGNVVDFETIEDLDYDQRRRQGIHHPSGQGMDIDPDAPKLRLLKGEIEVQPVDDSQA